MIPRPALLGAAATSLLGLTLLCPQLALAHEVETLPAIAAIGSLAACPVGGPSTFEDSWGDPRSSGRRHEGVDMAADRGTPVLAVVDGDAGFKRSNLGGNAIWLTTATGERFYYAHLDAWEGTSRFV